MKRNYVSVLVIVAMMCGSFILNAQQKNYINYQGVVRDADNELMVEESVEIGIALKFGTSNAPIQYQENHFITTDINGVFSLQIGSGISNSGDYENLPWGEASFVAVSFNGSELGTTELMAVPYAITSGSDQWIVDGNTIANKNIGEVRVTNNLKVFGQFTLNDGNAVNEISDDGTLLENSSNILPTQKAVKTYVDSRVVGGGESQNAVEVPFDNSESGLTAINVQDALDELVIAGMVGTDDDTDSTNELQDIFLSGTDLSISEGSTINLSAIIPPGGTDDQNASEVPFDNTGTSLAAGDTQAAIAELAAGGLVDTDDQDLSLSGTILQITDGASVDLSPIIPPGGTDDQEASEVPFDNTGTGLAAADTQAAIAELATGGMVDTDDQSLSLSGTMLQIDDGIGVDLAPLISSSGHDNQRLDFNESTGTLKIENGNAVNLSSLTDADSDPENEIDVTRNHGLLVGDDGIIDGLVGTADGQVAKWDAALGNWVAGTDEVGGGSASSVWDEVADGINYNDGNVSIGTTFSGHTPGASKYFTVSGGVANGDFGAIEIKGRQSTVGMPIGRFGFLSLGNTGSTFEIARIETRMSDGAQFRGDLGFFTMDGANSADALLQERMTIKRTGNVGIGTTNPTSKLDVEGTIKSSDLSGTGERNVVADADGNLMIGGDIGAIVNINDLADGKSNEEGSSLYVGNGAGNRDSDITGLNVGIGPIALYLNESGEQNTAIGSAALYNNTDGNFNVALGRAALYANINGEGNTGIGYIALQANTTGQYNTATGLNSLSKNENGDRNTAMGSFSLFNNLNGIYNTAIGASVLSQNTIGNYNIAIGSRALDENVSGDYNTANGYQALQNNTTGDYNTAIGRRSLYQVIGSWNTAVGNDALGDLLTGVNNIGIGADSQVPNSNGSHQVRIGNTQITYAGVQVAWNITSDMRWKNDVQNLPYGLNIINKLRPVDYIRKNNDSKIREIGFIAQEVEVLLNNLGYSEQGILSKDDQGFMSLRYNDFIPVLTKAIQEQQAIIDKQEKRILKLEERLVRLEAIIEK